MISGRFTRIVEDVLAGLLEAIYICSRQSLSARSHGACALSLTDKVSALGLQGLVLVLCPDNVRRQVPAAAAAYCWSLVCMMVMMLMMIMMMTDAV